MYKPPDKIFSVAASKNENLDDIIPALACTEYFTGICITRVTSCFFTYTEIRHGSVVIYYKFRCLRSIYGLTMWGECVRPRMRRSKYKIAVGSHWSQVEIWGRTAPNVFIVLVCHSLGIPTHNVFQTALQRCTYGRSRILFVGLQPEAHLVSKAPLSHSRHLSFFFPPMTKRHGDPVHGVKVKVKKRKGIKVRTVTVPDSDEEGPSNVNTEYVRLLKTHATTTGKADSVTMNSLPLFEVKNITHNNEPLEPCLNDQEPGETVSENTVPSKPVKKRRKKANDSVRCPIFIELPSTLLTALQTKMRMLNGKFDSRTCHIIRLPLIVGR